MGKPVSERSFLQIIYTLLFLALIGMILTRSGKSLYYALNGLNLWFQKMVPTLLPFMILSGLMVRMRLTEVFASFLHPLIAPVWKVRKNVTYAMIMGFLCGFPMGARVARDLLDREMITHREAEYLLAFCNNIGPVYFTGFVMPVLRRKMLWPYVLGMYGLPLLYGLILRHTVYKDIGEEPLTGTIVNKGNDLAMCSGAAGSLKILEELDDSIQSALRSIAMLGGYMVLFNLLNLVPDVLFSCVEQIIGSPLPENVKYFPAPLLEITGGIGMLGDRAPLLILVLLPFGGLCCIAQTYSILHGSRLSIGAYVRHKLILSAMTLSYYILWYVLFPGNFLR